jgi:3'-phosphoadenosine 5'-phosphosulfate sulfotransferase (PAPS reductase)/FAD synthetase
MNSLPLLPFMLEPDILPVEATLLHQDYDLAIVAFSGGKDSLACLLHLLELGFPLHKIELWHHDIDGPGADFMDWACTPAYCRGVAAALGIPIYFSWKVGGFKGEMLRQNAPTGPVAFEEPADIGKKVTVIGGDSRKLGTRLVFPQMSANLSVRWCSGYLKIDVGARAIINQNRFLGKRTLLITGERAEESADRAKYREQEPHKTDRRNGRLKRWVDHWRPVHQWSTAQVWEIIGRWKILPHPCYRLGWGRCSCAACIFGSANQWASLRVVDPAKFSEIADYESRFGKTIDRKLTVGQKGDRGVPYPATDQHDVISEAKDPDWDRPIWVDNWTMPAGAASELDGPC